MLFLVADPRTLTALPTSLLARVAMGCEPQRAVLFGVRAI
jgi:hypothetical protein